MIHFVLALSLLGEPAISQPCSQYETANRSACSLERASESPLRLNPDFFWAETAGGVGETPRAPRYWVHAIAYQPRTEFDLPSAYERARDRGLPIRNDRLNR